MTARYCRECRHPAGHAAGCPADDDVEPAEDDATLCWSCSKSYQMGSLKCPHCGATNANHDPDAAQAEAREEGRT
jgi:hypothetical protein